MSVHPGDIELGSSDPAAKSAPALMPYELWADDTSLPDWVHSAAETFDVVSLLNEVVPRCVTLAFPSFADDTQFLARLRSSISANAFALRSVIAGDLEIEDVYLTEVLDLAAIQAQLRVPQMAIQRSYRVSFYTMLEAWTEHIAAHARIAGIAPSEAAAGQKLLTQTVLSYQDFVAHQVAQAHTRDYELLTQSRAHMRRSMVRDILRDKDAVLSASDSAILAYDLTNHHLAVLLPSTPETKASQLAARIRAASNCQGTFVYPTTLTTTVVWFGRIDGWTDRAIDALRAILESDGVVASIGEPRRGIEGFRTSLQEAESAERVREAWGPEMGSPCIRFADVALETLVMQNPQLAQDFVLRELGALSQDTPEAARLRETIEASGRLGSHVATAEFLQLHEHTVRNRLQKVETQLGHPLAERTTEVQVAVRLARLIRPESM